MARGRNRAQWRSRAVIPHPALHRQGPEDRLISLTVQAQQPPQLDEGIAVIVDAKVERQQWVGGADQQGRGLAPTPVAPGSLAYCPTLPRVSAPMESRVRSASSKLISTL